MSISDVVYKKDGRKVPYGTYDGVALLRDPRENDSKEKRQKVKNYIESQGITVWCSCNERSEYKYSKPPICALNPASHDDLHQKDCPESGIYKATAAKCNKAFEEHKDKETGNIYIRATLKLDPARKIHDIAEIIQHQQDENSDIGLSGKRYPKNSVNQNTMTLEALCKKLNMMAFKHLSFHHAFLHYPKLDTDGGEDGKKTLAHQMHWATERIKIKKGNKFLADYKVAEKVAGKWVDKDGFRFIYDFWVDLGQDPYHNNDKDVQHGRLYIPGSSLYPDNKDKDMVVDQAMWDNACQTFEKTWKMHPYDLPEGSEVLLMGFLKKPNVNYLPVLLLVSEYGLLCDSNYEAQFQNAFFSMSNELGWKQKGVHGWKPWAYGYGAYEDKFLEDFIVDIDGCKKKIIVEIYGMNYPEYLERKALKTQIMLANQDRYIYVPWEANDNKRSLDEVMQTLKHHVESIIKERG